MREDLDQAMESAEIDALWVHGNLFDNPDMVYMAGIQHVNDADLFKLKGKAAVLFHFTDMEREEAQKSGLQTQSYFSQKTLSEYMQHTGGDIAAAMALRVKEAMAEYGITTGKVAISGRANIGPYAAVLEKLKPMLPAIQFTGYFNASPFLEARMTKSADEIRHIRRMGQITTEVIGRVQRFLQDCEVKKDRLLLDGKNPLTIADVKSRINLWLAELGASNPEETIFAIGRDGGIPHSAGTGEDVITLGNPIVFDIFPCESGGGYFYDCTRTWCLGYAPDAVAQLHQQVLDVHQQLIASLEEGKPFKDYQKMACELFAQAGHITISEDKTTQKGYLHSIGHGVGLEVHEKPFSGFSATEDERLIPGVVFTIEPGLYYPDQGMGVRIEDTIYLDQKGKFEILAEYPYDLVIPMENKK
mgnify:CR=1 FL=1